MACLSRLTALAVALMSFALLAEAHLSLPMEKKHVMEDGTLEPFRGVYPRSVDTVDFDALAYGGNGAYCINVTVGTPPQMQTVLFDTGSSELYFMSAEACANPLQVPCKGGVFNGSATSTVKLLERGALYLSYAEGSWVVGDYISDVIGIGDVQIPDVQFGVATGYKKTGGFARGLMGVGYSTLESHDPRTTPAVQNHYPNIIDTLHESGVTQSRLYSLWLNDNGFTTTGNVIFGGIDTSLFTGPMIMVDAQVTREAGTSNDTIVRPLTPITALKMNNSGIVSNIQTANPDGTPHLVDVDSGTSDWPVPTAWFNQIVAAWNLTLGPYNRVSCDHLDDDFTISVEFSNAITIQVPAKNMLMPFYNGSTIMTDTNGVAICTFMFTANDQVEAQGYSFMGDTIMRSMYVVYDQDNGQMGIAQSNVNPGTSNVLDVPSGPNQVVSVLQSHSISIQSAAPNTWSIPAEIPATVNMTYSTVSPPIGTATGSNARPLDAVVTAGASFRITNSLGSTIDPFSIPTSTSSLTSSVASATGTTADSPGSAPTSATSSSASASASKGAAPGIVADSAGLTRVLAVWLGLVMVGFIFNL